MQLELLAPAGNLEKLKIAFSYGADAVYLAGQKYSLRSAASNFSMEEIRKAVKFAHTDGKKVYITVNAFLHDDDMEWLPEYIQEIDHLQPDALICSDLGVIKIVQQQSSIPIHVSTQASVLNSSHAALWKDVGVKRIVTGREISIEEAGQIKRKTGLEVEMFIHGAMCMSHSGHCSMSTYIANRDSNRGGCIQNCRFYYSIHEGNQWLAEGNLLSSKDLCGIHLLRVFLDEGIDSVKIEGRMKSNLYVATCVRAYTNALKEIQSDPSADITKWVEELSRIPHRSYTEASLRAPAGDDSIYSEEYQKGTNYKMAGTVLGVDVGKNRFAFQVRNKIAIGDSIEVMTFGTETVHLTITEIRNLADQKMEIAQPNAVIWLPLQPGIESRNVARIKRS